MPNGFRSLSLARAVQEKTGLFAYLGSPFLLIYGGFLLVMVSLSFAIPGLHSLSMQIRWPILGFVALAGALYPILETGCPSWTPVQKLMALFVTLLGLSSIYSLERDYTAQRAISLALLFLATCVGLYSYCRNWKNVVLTTDLFWCIGALLVLTGFVFRANAGASASGARYEGLHSRATGAGTYAALFLPIAIYQASYRLKGVLKYVGWMIVVLLLAQAGLAGARAAAVVGLALTLGLGFAYNASRASIAFVLILVLAPLPLLIDPKNVDRLVEKSDRLVRTESFATFTGRLDRWKFGFEQWGKKPIFGNGFGASRTLAGNEDPRRFKLQPGEVFNLHSDHIEVLMDVGVIGYLPFAAFWIVLLTLGFRTMMSPRSPQRQLSLAYFGSVIYAFSDTFMHGGFLAAGGGVSAFSWSMIAVFLATESGRDLLPMQGPRFSAASIPIPAAGRPPAPVDPRLNLPSVRRLLGRGPVAAG